MANYNFKHEAQVYVYPTIDIERGLTVSETHTAKVQIDGNVGAFLGSKRIKKVFMAGEVVLPASFTNDVECLFEHGGTGEGCWIGITTDSGVKNFHFRVGDGASGSTNQVQSTERIYKKIPISQIPEFDGKEHTVAWEFDPPNNTAKFWIDNRLILSEAITDLSDWSGGNEGGWLKGYNSIAGFGNGSAGDPYRTEWSGTAGSELRVYSEQSLTYINTPVLLDVTEDLEFTQTFTDTTFEQRTIHQSNKVFDASNIKKANPANFGFVIPALVEDDLQIVVDLLVDYDGSGSSLNTFDLFIKLPNDVYRLENCVITNGTFMIEKSENLKLGIQGQASKLTRGQTFPGNEGSRSANATAQRLDHLLVQIVDAGGTPTTLGEGIFSVSVELQNNIKWNPYETVHDALNVSNANTSMYPSNFTLEKRILSGSIGQYIQSNFNADVQQWKTNQNIIIKAGEAADVGFQFDLENCTFTNRHAVEDVFTQRYDWKMNDNPADLGTKIKFNNNS